MKRAKQKQLRATIGGILSIKRQIQNLLFLLVVVGGLEKGLWAAEEGKIQRQNSAVENGGAGFGEQLPELLQEVISDRNTIFSVGKLYHLILNATDEELALIWNQYPKDVRKLGSIGRGRARPEDILEILAERDPELAVKLAESEKSPSRRALYLDAALAGWARGDLPSALRYFEDIESGQVKNEMSNRFLKAVARQDHQQALKLATEVFGRDLLRRTVTVVFGEWLQVDPAGVAAFLEQNPEYAEITHVYTPLTANWALIDPVGLKTWAEGTLSRSARRAVDAVLSLVPSLVDPGTRMAEISQMPYGDKREQAIGLLGKEIMWSGFDTAKQWLASIEDRNDKTVATRVLAYAWIENDPEGFAEALKDYPEDHYKGMLMTRLVEVWGEKDPRRAVRWASSIPIGSRYDRVLENLFEVALKTDFEFAFEALNRLPEGRRKQFISNLAVRHLAELDSSRAVDFVLEQPAGRVREGLLRDLLAELIKHDPEELYPFLDGFPPSDESDSLRRRAAWLLAQKDLNRALSWARGTQGEHARHQALIGLLGDWVRQSPKGAKEFAQGLEKLPDRSRAVGTIAIALSQVSVDESIAWLRKMGDSINGSDVIPPAVRSLARANPVKTGAYVEALERGGVKQTALYILVDEWAHKAPQTAIEWFLSRPEKSQTRKSGLEECFGIWARDDVLAFEAWLVDQDQGPARDMAISAMVHALDDCPGVKSVYWANLISDDEQRFILLRYCLREWLRCDRRAAEEWINSSDLPKEFLDDFNQEEKRLRFDEKKHPA